MIAVHYGHRTRAQADIERMNAAAEREIAEHNARFPLIAPYDRFPGPKPLPLSWPERFERWWDSFDNFCARITWLHVSIAGAIAAIFFVLVVLVSVLFDG